MKKDNYDIINREMTEIFYFSDPENFLRKILSLTQDSTFEIILIYDKVHWLRIFYNNVSRIFNISIHNSRGWKDSMGREMTMCEILCYLDATESQFYNFDILQYRTSSSTTIYKNTTLL